MFVFMFLIGDYLIVVFILVLLLLLDNLYDALLVILLLLLLLLLLLILDGNMRYNIHIDKCFILAVSFYNCM